MNGVFEGVKGAISLSVIAFSIVFLALIGLTAIIYGIRIMAGSKPKPQSQGTGPKAPESQIVQTAASKAVVPEVQGSAVSKEVVAAVTGALMARIKGGFQIVGIRPQGESGAAQDSWVSWGRYDCMQGSDRSVWNTK